MRDPVSQSLSYPVASDHGLFPPAQQMTGPNAASFEDKESGRILPYGCLFQGLVQP